MAKDLKAQNVIAWTVALILDLKAASTSMLTRAQVFAPNPASADTHTKRGWTTSTIHRLEL